MSLFSARLIGCALTLLVCSFVLQSQSFGALDNVIETQRMRDQPTESDVVYRTVDGIELKLDFYSPRELTSKSASLIVWIHGGAWRSGSKSDVPIQTLRDFGFAIASIDYRLSPVAKFPAQAQDIHASIRFLRDHSDRFSIDPNRIVIAGASAGGHLAALVGVSSDVPEFIDPTGVSASNSRVQAIVSFYGASNLQTILSQSTPHGLSVRVPALELLLGGQPVDTIELARLASPVVHVNASDPPLWLFHGDQDPQMPINQSHEIEGVYRKHRLTCKFTVLHGSKHGGKEFYSDIQMSTLAEGLRKTLDARIE